MFSNLEEIKERVNSLIEADEQMEQREKAVWESVFAALACYQHDKFEELWKKLEPGEEHNSGEWRIHTALIHKDKGASLDTKRWSYVLDECDEFPEIWNERKELNEGKELKGLKSDRVVIARGYLDAAWEEIGKLTGFEKKYTGKIERNGAEREFGYSLLLNDSLVQQEQVIYDLAELYAVDRPLLFAPMFRRYVDVVADRLENGDVLKSLELGENRLEGKLLLNYRSIWNILRIETVTPDVSWKNPVRELDGTGREDAFHKYYIDQNEYIHVPPEMAQKLRFIHGMDRERGSYVSLREVPDLDTRHREKYILTTLPSVDVVENRYLFSTVEAGIRKNDLPDRVHSRADVERLLVPFEDSWGLKLQNLYVNQKEETDILEYPLHFQYYDRNQEFSRNAKKQIVLLFVRNDDRFQCDRIIALVNFLNRYYPEFGWKGGIRDE